ncbi:hypothetical protein [Oryza sativa Japonica Group]|uniref:Uncharacterized protein n=1 Tax=Oryza sativa subsp. japonica TaxID=39947 RepID=Q9AS07_ORYSJ|nr:hypothetical protein [Oryza sativa Japonica Group]
MGIHSPWSRYRDTRVTEKPDRDKSHVLGLGSCVRYVMECGIKNNRIGNEGVTLLDGREGHYGVGNVENMMQWQTGSKGEVGAIRICAMLMKRCRRRWNKDIGSPLVACGIR